MALWNEYLAQMWSIQKSDEEVYTNIAYGGAWASTYDHQLSVWNLIRHPLATIKTLIVGKLIPPSLGFTVQGYLLKQDHLSNQSVYFIFSGVNDYLNVLFWEDNYNLLVMSKYVDNVIENLSAAILKLERAGAKRFVIMGLPHIGDMPRFVHTTDREVLNAAIDQHNTRLEARIEEWKKLYPKSDFLFINTDQFLAKALAAAEQYGFVNSTEACIDVKFPMWGAFAHSPFAGNYVMRYAQVMQYKDPNFVAGQANYQLCDNPEEYLFWDEIHPSTRAHHYLAYGICMAMKEHGYSVNCTKPNPV